MVTDPYSDPRTGVLVNKLGLSTKAALDRAERDLTSFALLRLRRRPISGHYDLPHLQAIHGAIFGDIYAWAGKIRTVSIAKGDVFCLPQHIETYAAEVFSQLEKENQLHGLGRQEFVERLTYYVGEVNAIHPFREGNGRAQRAFFEQLTLDAGFGTIAWRRLDAKRNVAASIAIMRGDPDPMRLMLDELLP
jgi:cell filamentation protein